MWTPHPTTQRLAEQLARSDPGTAASRTITTSSACAGPFTVTQVGARRSGDDGGGDDGSDADLDLTRPDSAGAGAGGAGAGAGPAAERH
ncbi:hypothetical protein GPECTOR_76g785 [Gonium pectorale]|uniref:Uncharacterized protein n=1 Tax=Gonium pectorale TaxID=33097 RepID=A0A150G2B1_GONPE|nr:hypothetical protein GPECTOR_76g785 [Gonium pectorale]|eukprot:KXZ43964.1 hypothetical protein GPECTOR_76g785 [Gonium pectorale]